MIQLMQIIPTGEINIDKTPLLGIDNNSHSHEHTVPSGSWRACVYVLLTIVESM